MVGGGDVEGGSVPGRRGTGADPRGTPRAVYDVDSERSIRLIHVAGTLRFATDRDTRLDVGLIKIQAGNDATEDGFNCDEHAPEASAGLARPTLEVGSASRPVDPKHTATIRLTHINGMSRQTSPAIVSCGGRMDSTARR